MSAQVKIESSASSEERKFRKTRDYFGKRKYSSMIVAAGEKGKLGYDEDSNDSGVSTRDMLIIGGGGSSSSGMKYEPHSPSTASVTSGISSASSPSSSKSDEPLKQRMKIIRLSNTSIQSVLQRGSVGSSTPVQTTKPIRRSVTPKLDKETPPVEKRSLEQVKRKKWETDLEKVMKLIQGSSIIRGFEKQVDTSILKGVEAITMTSSKRRIIPKQRISV